MQTKRFIITGDEKHDRAIYEEAAALIRAGELVAFPTETVYGLGANALDGEAVKKIYVAKGRPSWNPLITHVSSREMLNTLVRSYPKDFETLAAKFMPGPLTFLLPKTDIVPKEVSAGLDSTTVRMPNHPVALKLIAAAGVPIAAPSANRSGRTSPTTAVHVLEDLDGRIAAVIDGGTCAVGVESTVIDIMQEPPLILRPGGVTKEEIEAVLGRPVSVFKKSAEGTDDKGLPSPGMTLRHYAPNAKLINTGDTAESLFSELETQLTAGHKVGILLPSDWKLPAKQGSSKNVVIYDYGSWTDWQTMAQRVFDGLRWLDKQGVNVIIGPLPPEQGLGLALRDRLIRAAK